MGVSNRGVQLDFNGDILWGQRFDAAQNSVSPTQIAIQNLAMGANTITVPTGGDSVPTAVTIIPPADNTTAITLKGVSGDTGIRIHDTDPTSIGLDDTVATFVLNAAVAVEGVRLIWS